jgi:hypothetical protein
MSSLSDVEEENIGTCTEYDIECYWILAFVGAQWLLHNLRLVQLVLPVLVEKTVASVTGAERIAK